MSGMTSLRHYPREQIYAGMLLSASFGKFGEVQPIASDCGVWARDLEGKLFFIHQLHFCSWYVNNDCP